VLDRLHDRDCDTAYVERARVFRAVSTLIRQLGLNGDMFAPDVPKCGSHNEEMYLINALGLLPYSVRRNPLALRLLRAAVLTSEVHVCRN
jgi:hypothetical protein